MSASIKTLMFASALSMLSLPAFAKDTINQTSRSVSYSGATTQTLQQRSEQLKQATPVVAPKPATGARVESSLKALHIAGSSANPDFSIYDVSTDLISDLDDDGFYHRFSVRIDADTYFDSAWVYARLYVSYEGGPWSWYATSEDYRISGDSTLDSFVIETELADGFPPGYYDVRIELYDADYGDFLLSYGPYDDSSLAALPLEDSYEDDTSGVSVGIGVEVGLPQTEVVIAGAGAFGWWLLLPFGVLLARRLSRK